ncbi:MAG: hypothetical protein KAJ22_01490 [Candidatus Izimaplasma sp.]|nr:hypothetical protein [Candidatus Izimaplasma bacterium]
MRNKTILILALMTLFFLLTGCSKNGNLPENIIGTYTYSECVYLNPLSSSTMDGYTGSNNDMFTYELKEYEFIMYTVDNEIIEEYVNVEYIEVDVYLDNDDLFNLFASDFLDTIDYRYDIYSDGDRIEYLIYIKDEEIFIAELKDIGGTTSGFSIWAIFNIK